MEFFLINEVISKNSSISLHSSFLFCILISLIFEQAVFQRYLRPEKDYVSFSLIYNNGKRSLDLVSDSLCDSMYNYNIILFFVIFCIFHFNNFCVVFS